MVKKIIQLILSNEAEAFVRCQQMKVQLKIAYNIRRLESGAIDKELFKKLGDTDIWELRTLFNGMCYRLFAFWDTETRALVIATHGIVKKTQKTPKKRDRKSRSNKKNIFQQ